MDKCKYKTELRIRRKHRVRKKISGSAECPRLSIFRSLRHMYAQVIDDENGVTLAAASTMSEKFEDLKAKGNCQAASKVGEAVARKAMALGIRRVCFDRSGFQYHGRVRALAEAARKTGLLF